MPAQDPFVKICVSVFWIESNRFFNTRTRSIVLLHFKENGAALIYRHNVIRVLREEFIELQ